MKSLIKGAKTYKLVLSRSPQLFWGCSRKDFFPKYFKYLGILQLIGEGIPAYSGKKQINFTFFLLKDMSMVGFFVAF